MSDEQFFWTIKDGTELPEDLQFQMRLIDRAEIHGEPVDWPITPMFAESHLGVRVALLLDGDEDPWPIVIGFVVYEFEQSLGALFLHRMAVKWQFQRRGVCRSLIESATTIISKRHQVRVAVACVNEYWLTAQLALRAMGFAKELDTQTRDGMPDLYWFRRKEATFDASKE